MERPIHRIEIVGSNALELLNALSVMVALTGRAPMEIDIAESEYGQELAEVILIEETLTDGSKVYNVELRFSNVQ